MQIASPPSAAPRPALLRQVQQLVDGWRAEHGVPGVAVSMRDAGAAVFDVTSGVASLATGRALSTSDRMWAGSISKTVTAATVLGLVADGRLSLDDPLSRWHPEVRNADRISVRMLLDHTSGLPDVTNEDGAYRKHAGSSPLVPWSRTQLLDAVAAHPGGTEPGAGFAYSNANYILLGDIVERVGGASLDAQVAARVLQPAGATSAQLDVGAGDNPATVAAHGDPGDGSPLVDTTWRFGPGSFTRSTLLGAGGLVTSAPDLARIGEAILWRGGAALDEASRATMLRAADASEDGYGLGAFTFRLYAGGDEPSAVYGHNGHLGGAASSMLLHVPDSEQTIAIMLPSDPPGGDATMPAARLASRLLDLAAGR